jgi:hypothetical protein
MSRSRSLWFAVLAVAVVIGCGKKDAPPDGGRSSDDAAAREEAKARLQKVGAGWLDLEMTIGSYPAGIGTKGGEIGLSWRVQILPYIDEGPLRNEFKDDEPWDSEHNQKLIEKMPKVFESPGKSAPPGHTYLRSFVGQKAIIPHRAQLVLRPGLVVRGRPLLGLTDGTSNTLMVAEAAEAVPWTKPDELPYDPGQPVPKLGGLFPDGFHAVMADGKVVFFPADLSEASLRALITIDAGDKFGPDAEKVLYPEGRPKADKAPPDILKK